MPDSWTEALTIKAVELVNVLVYVLLVSSNFYLEPRKLYFATKETYISPATWAFRIWTAIDVFLLGTIIYQFFPNGRRVIVEGISWRFSLLGIASAIYLNLWMHHYHTLDFIFSAVSFVTATHLYYLLKKNYPSRSLVDEICIHLPFSLYHSWSTFLVLLSAFEAFGSRRQGLELAGPWTKISVFLVFVFLETTAISYTFSTPEGDFPASLIICLCLFAVFGQQQSSAFIHGFALGFAILSILWAVKNLYGLVFRYRNLLGIGVEDPERAPLVGGV